MAASLQMTHSNAGNKASCHTLALLSAGRQAGGRPYLVLWSTPGRDLPSIYAFYLSHQLLLTYRTRLWLLYQLVDLVDFTGGVADPATSP